MRIQLLAAYSLPMCTRYRPPEERYKLGGPLRLDDWLATLTAAAEINAWDAEPLAPIVRRARGQADAAPESLTGRWGMLPPPPPGSKARVYPTYNARVETIGERRTYAQPWAKAQRCLIPAFYWLEPCWETGKNQWWRFARADGAPWMLAGIWREWTDAQTGEIVTGYSMVTCNADDHPIMRRMHKPDPKLPADQQDKRSVVPLEAREWDAWLYAPVAEAARLVKPPEPGLMEAAPS